MAMRATSLSSMFTEKVVSRRLKVCCRQFSGCPGTSSLNSYKLPQFVFISSPPPQLPLAWYHIIHRLRSLRTIMCSSAPIPRRLTAPNGKDCSSFVSNAYVFSLEQERTRIIELLEMALINGAFSTPLLWLP